MDIYFSKLRLSDIACALGTLAVLWSCGSDSNEPGDSNAKGGSSGASSTGKGGRSQTTTGGSSSGTTGGSQGTGGTQGNAGTSSQAGTGNGSGGGTGGSGNATGGTAGSGGTSAGGQNSGSKACAAGPFAALPFEGDEIEAKRVAGTETNQGSHLYEGPVWIGGALYYTSFDHNDGANASAAKIQKLVPPSTVTTAVQNSGSNGLAVDPDGFLVACMQGTQSVTRINLSNGDRTPLISEFNGSPFNSPNDLAIRSDGTIYFTDPDYQRDGREGQSATRVYRLTKDGKVFDLEPSGGRVDLPNGIALSPDEKTLYVAANRGGYVRKFSVNADGTTESSSEFTSEVDGPDGMGMDCAGNLYVTQHGAGNVRVFTSNGDSIGTIIGDPPMSGVTNVAFGGSDRKTLYITTGKFVYSVNLAIPGLPY